MTTHNNIADIIIDSAKLIASMPNTLTMCDARAIAFADLSSALRLCATYFADFVATNDKAIARKYLALTARVSDALTLLAAPVPGEAKEVGQSLLLAQRALVEAHAQFQAHVQKLLKGAA